MLLFTYKLPVGTYKCFFFLVVGTYLHLHYQSNPISKIYIAFDGRGESESYRQKGVIFSDVLQGNSVGGGGGFHNGKRTPDYKFVDMFVAIHSDLFILNPRSTFSWEIYLVRLCLGLLSVPVVRTNDLYLRKLPEEEVVPNGMLWVSWTSVIDAFLS